MTSYGIDLRYIPDLVREDKEVLGMAPGTRRDQRQVEIVESACRRLREAQPELNSLDGDALYDLVAQALAEENG